MNVWVQDLTLDNLVVSVPQGVLYQDLGEETIILNVDSGEYYGLNDVGSRLWALLQVSGSMKELICVMLNEYEVSEEHLRKELRQFLGVLQSKGLIEVHGTENA